MTDTNTQIADELVKAIENAGKGYSIKLTRLVDGQSTYELSYNGEVTEHGSYGDATVELEMRARAEKVDAAMSFAQALRTEARTGGDALGLLEQAAPTPCEEGGGHCCCERETCCDCEQPRMLEPDWTNAETCLQNIAIALNNATLFSEDGPVDTVVSSGDLQCLFSLALAAAFARHTLSHPTPADDALHPATSDLVDRFAVALKEKLAASERKYGWTDEWAKDDWQERCQRSLAEHLAKGDPRDVAAFAAFMWHHGWPTVSDDARTPDDVVDRAALAILAEEELSDFIRGTDNEGGFEPLPAHSALSWAKAFARAALTATDDARTPDDVLVAASNAIDEIMDDDHGFDARDLAKAALEAAALTASGDARERALRPILEDMAKQHLVAEMEDPDGDYQFAYECMVRAARKALALLDKPTPPDDTNQETTT